MIDLPNVPMARRILISQRDKRLGKYLVQPLLSFGFTGNEYGFPDGGGHQLFHLIVQLVAHRFGFHDPLGTPHRFL